MLGALFSYTGCVCLHGALFSSKGCKVALGGRVFCPYYYSVQSPAYPPNITIYFGALFSATGC